MVKLFEFPKTSELELKHGITVPEEIKGYHQKLGLCLFVLGLMTGLAFTILK